MRSKIVSWRQSLSNDSNLNTFNCRVFHDKKLRIMRRLNMCLSMMMLSWQDLVTWTQTVKIVVAQFDKKPMIFNWKLGNKVSLTALENYVYEQKILLDSSKTYVLWRFSQLQLLSVVKVVHLLENLAFPFYILVSLPTLKTIRPLFKASSNSEHVLLHVSYSVPRRIGTK